MTEPYSNLVDYLERARDAMDGKLKLLIVTGAGVTQAAVPSLSDIPETASATWQGLIARALEYLASEEIESDPERRRQFRQWAAQAKEPLSTAELLDHGDRVFAAFQRIDAGRGNPELSLWIHKELSRLESEVKAQLEADRSEAPLLTAIRCWQADLGAIIATTNYDGLLTAAGCGGRIALHEKELVADAEESLRDILEGARNVIHLHGRYDFKGSAVLSRGQYRKLADLNRRDGSFARGLFDSSLPIFVGCGAGLADADLLNLIGKREAGRNHDLRAVVLQVRGDSSIECLRGRNPFRQTCRFIEYGTDYADIVPFLDRAREALVHRGFAEATDRRGTLWAARAIRRYLSAESAAPATVSIPPVALGARVRDIPLLRFFGAVLRHLGPSFEFQYSDGAEVGARPDDAGRFDPVELEDIEASPFSVVLGDPGSGKTSLLRLIFRRTLAEEKGPRQVPMFVRIPDYFRARTEARREVASGPLDLWAYFVRQILRAQPEPGPVPPASDLEDALAAAAEMGRLAVLLDGLDELAHSEDRARMVREIAGLHEHLTSARSRRASGINRLTVSSRHSGYRAAPVTHADAHHFTLGALDRAQVEELHDFVFDALAVASPNDRRRLGRLRGQLRRALGKLDEQSVCWIDTPLMAVLVAAGFVSDGILAKSKQSLYERIIALSCAWMLGPDEDSASLALTAAAVKSILAEAAYRIFETGTHDVLSVASLRNALADWNPSADGALLDRLIAALTSEESLLRERSTGFFAFIHRGLLEYFCGVRLHADRGRIAERTQEPAWHEPASFACAFAMQDMEEEAGALARQIADLSSPANGARPLTCLLRGGWYASRLSAAARAAIANATLVVMVSLAAFLDDIADHRRIHRLLASLRGRTGMAATFEAEILAALRISDSGPERLLAATLLADGILKPTATLVQALDAALAGRGGRAAALCENMQRRFTARMLIAKPNSEPALAFGRAVTDLPNASAMPAGTQWRRVLLALAGGVVDFDQPAVHRLNAMLARFLAADDSRRNALLATLPEELRRLALQQESALIDQMLKQDDKRFGSPLAARRELLRRPDLVMAFALHLDLKVKAASEKSDIQPSFDPRAFYRTPELAPVLLEAMRLGRSPDTVACALRSGDAPSPEQTVMRLVLGLPVDPADLARSRDRLEQAAAGIADAGLRSLIAVDRGAVVLGETIGDEVAILLASTVAGFKVQFNQAPQPLVAEGDHRAGFSEAQMVESAGRMLGGGHLSDAVYDAMVFLDVFDAPKRVGVFLEAGRSRMLQQGATTFDLPPLPLAHLHDDEVTIVGDLIDILEACPPNVSALRGDTLVRLSEIASGRGDDAGLEFAAALAIDWGAQAYVTRANHEKDRVWIDQPEAALAEARAATPSIWRARALIRLLRTAPAAERAAREAEASAAVDALADPFEKVLGFELLAARATPVTAMDFARRAFDLLWSANPRPRRLFARAPPASLADPERCARLFVRLSAWLDRDRRARALRAAAELAAAVENGWSRTILLHEIRPYVSHEPQALAAWSRAVHGSLPSYHRAYVEERPGEMLRLIADSMDTHEAFADGRADPLVAYALLRDGLRRTGSALAPWEVLETAPATREAAAHVRAAFDSDLVPSLSAAGVLRLRAFIEAGFGDVATFVLERVPRHPPGAAAVIDPNRDPELFSLIQAANRGIDPFTAPFVVGALASLNEARQALAATILEAAPPSDFSAEAERGNRIFTVRRASIEGVDTLLALAASAAEGGRSAGHRHHVHWYVGSVLFETPGHARQVAAAAAAPETRMAAHSLLARIGMATPQFLGGLFNAVPLEDMETQRAILALTARALSQGGLSTAILVEHGVIGAVQERLRADARTICRVIAAEPADAAIFFSTHPALESAAATADEFVASRHAPFDPGDSDATRRALAAWGWTFLVQYRTEAEPRTRAAADLLSRDLDGLAALVRYCTDDAISLRNARELDMEGRLLSSFAWPLLAACVERAPMACRSLMLDARLFEHLPAVGNAAPSFPVRRAAFLLMPLEWQDGAGGASFDLLRAALDAGTDLWPVREAALAAAGSIRKTGDRALEQLMIQNESHGGNALMLCQILRAILDNDQAFATSRRSAQSLLDQILRSDVAGRLVPHSITTMNCPPRTRVAKVVLGQIFGAA